MGKAIPAPHLVNGLRHLLKDVSAPTTAVHTGLSGVVCGETELIGFRDDRVSYCGIDVQQQPHHGFE